MKISVLTPSYNSGKFIQRAIESVLQQDYKDFEHIIIDGGSKDNTIEILNEYPHLAWISEKDNGQSDAMNKAFKKSSGDIIVYLNADDYFLPGAFKTVIKEFQLNKNIDAVIGNLYILHEGSMKPQIPLEKLSEIILYWNYSFPLNPVGYFYKREVQFKIGSFPNENHYSMDYWFVLRLYKKFRLLKIEEFLGVFDLHSLTKSKNNDGVDSLFLESKKFLTENKLTYLKLNFYISFYFSRIINFIVRIKRSTKKSVRYMAKKKMLIK